MSVISHLPFINQTQFEYLTHENCFALLDDATSEEARSRLYAQYLATIELKDASQWDDAWDQVTQALQQSLYIVPILTYELGAALHQVHQSSQHNNENISCFLVFKEMIVLRADEVEKLLTLLDEEKKPSTANAPTGIAHLQSNIQEAQFIDAINRIQDYIKVGDTYQVNFTFQFNFEIYGSLYALYRQLRTRQPVPYGAYIRLPTELTGRGSSKTILSFSPELFFKHEKTHLLARPMKGTAPAFDDKNVNAKCSKALSQDPKNQSENVMIVDLIRNDMGRIAKTGSVKVERLFDVQQYGQVLQMTSTIEAQLKEACSLSEIMRALYPCGSITGAPKIRTMQIINELEKSPRGVYTGAIGWFDPPQAQPSIGDFCLSVPIRTLQINQVNAINTTYSGMMGVGAGIVIDSNAKDEWQECLLKARFLTQLLPDFTLFETLRISQKTYQNLERHLSRLKQSASTLQFSYDESSIQNDLSASLLDLEDNQHYRLRLSIQANGVHHIRIQSYTPIQHEITFLLSSQLITTPHLLRQHKTSVRSEYDAAIQVAVQKNAFDTVFINEKGYITEGGRTNIAIKLKDKWYTPPLSDGVLPGIMRSILLQDACYQVQEKSLTPDDVKNADAILLCNALHGYMSAKLTH